MKVEPSGTNDESDWFPTDDQRPEAAQEEENKRVIDLKAKGGTKNTSDSCIACRLHHAHGSS